MTTEKYHRPRTHSVDTFQPGHHSSGYPLVEVVCGCGWHANDSTEEAALKLHAKHVKKARAPKPQDTIKELKAENKELREALKNIANRHCGGYVVGSQTYVNGCGSPRAAAQAIAIKKEKKDG